MRIPARRRLACRQRGAYAVLRLRGHGCAQAAALVLRYRPQAEMVPAYVRSVERWLATAAPVTSATTTP